MSRKPVARLLGGADADRSLERNLRLIPMLSALTRSMVHLPVFVLFTRSRFEVSGALELAGLTYLFIVALEVPSGWMSDRLGRVPTLTVAAVSWVAAHACFLLGGESFLVIALGTFFISAGWAFISGTDVSLHYDTLEALGRESDYAERQSRVSAIGYVSTAVSAIAGGLLGLIDLRLAFGVALALAAVQIVLTRMLYEPEQQVHAEALFGQIGKCLGYLRNGFMGWLFMYGIALVTLEHVAFTLMQPWLTAVLGKDPDELGATPLVAGVLFAIVAGVGAIAARRSASVERRFGTVGSLVLLGVVSAVVVTGMALTVSVAMLALAAFRSVQGAAAPVIISAAVAPRTAPHHRATLLSINSLAGRLTYGLLLQLVALDVVDDPLPVLRLFSVISWGLVVLLIASGVWVQRSSLDSGSDQLRFEQPVE